MGLARPRTDFKSFNSIQFNNHMQQTQHPFSHTCSLRLPRNPHAGSNYIPIGKVWKQVSSVVCSTPQIFSNDLSPHDPEVTIDDVHIMYKYRIGQSKVQTDHAQPVLPGVLT